METDIDEREWEFGMLVKVVGNESIHCIPIGMIVKVIAKEDDGTIMLNYRDTPRWAAPVDLGKPYAV